MDFNDLKNNLKTPISSNKEERKPSEFWANIGIYTGDEKYPVITLPFGNALDNQTLLKIRGSNEEFKQFTHDRNRFLAMMLEESNKLKPGESKILGSQPEPGSVVVQLHRTAKAESEPTGEVKSFLDAVSL